jgi:predicted O-linked N-acetylglucosamine transferase (SPINDLY family)
VAESSHNNEDASLRAAIALHRDGRLGEAEPLYRQAMARNPGLFAPHYFLGVMRNQQGRHGEAAALLEQALGLEPRNLRALIQQGLALRALGRAADALACFDAALALDRALPETHYNRAVALNDLARPGEALAAYEEAAALRPGFAAAETGRALTLHQLGRLAEAVSGFDRALALLPGDARLLTCRGLALSDLGQLEEAEASYASALASDPDHADARSNRGQLAWRRGEVERALADFDRVLAGDPGHIPALTNRALALGAAGRLAEALADYDRLLTLAPADAEIWNRRGAVLRLLGRGRAALDSFDTALRWKPDFPAALNNRGFLRWNEEMDYAAAKADLERALALDPGFPFLAGELLYLKMQAADWENSASDRATLAAAVAAGRLAVRPFAWQAISADPALLQQCARLFAAAEYPAIAATPPVRRRAGGKIRLGYLSADFRDQATAHLMAGVYEAHDRDAFEIVALDNGAGDGSPMRDRLERTFDRFLPIAALPDDAAAAAVREAGIDILVNLNGYFGKPRMGVFARRAAPLQVNYLGFPATLGAPYMDYIIADRTVIPDAERGFYDEQVVWLPDCYQANDRKRPRPAPPAREAAGLPRQGFVFCNFNQTYKITPEIFALWMRLLRGRPESVLWLLRDNDTAPLHLRRTAANTGVAAERLIFADLASQEAHLARLALADLALDTMPYNSHTTGSDALWAGVPLVTCRGTAFPGRVAASLLQAAGLPDLVTDSLEDYVRLAGALAADPDLLARTRARLADNRLACPLFDTQGFTRNLEEAYRLMWRRHEAGERPSAFAVSPPGK